MNFSNSIETKRQKKGFFLLTVLCVIVGAVFRILYFIIYPVQPRDSFFYVELISEWIDTGKIHGISFFPLSLWILKIPNLVFHCDILKGGLVVNHILGLLFIITIMISVQYLFEDNRINLVVGLAMATHPKLIAFSCSFLRENSYLVFCSLSFLFLIKYARTMNVKNILGASICAALSFLCRLEGFEILAIFNIILLGFLFFRKIKLSKALRHSILFLLVFFFTAVTMCLFLHFDYSDLNSNDVIYHKVVFPNSDSQ